MGDQVAVRGLRARIRGWEFELLDLIEGARGIVGAYALGTEVLEVPVRYDGMSDIVPPFSCWQCLVLVER